MGRKRDFQGPEMILHSFHVQILPIPLISILNLKVCPKVKLSALIGLN